MIPEQNEPAIRGTRGKTKWAGRPLFVLFSLAIVQMGLIIWFRMGQDSEDSAAQPVTAGALLPPMMLFDISGEAVSLDPSALPACTSLIFFAPQCPSCTASAPAWSSDFTAETNRRAVGVGFTSPDSAREYAATHRLSFPIYTRREGNLRLTRATGVSSVPTIIQLDEGGIIRKVVRGGPYDKSDLTELDACSST